MYCNYDWQLVTKLEALREEYMRFAVEKCACVLREYRPAVENITGFPPLHFSSTNLYFVTLHIFCCMLINCPQADVLLAEGEIKADEIWDIYNSSPRIPQVCSELSFQNKVCLGFCFIIKRTQDFLSQKGSVGIKMK